MRNPLLLLLALGACQSTPDLLEVGQFQTVELFSVEYRGWLRADAVGLVRDPEVPSAMDETNADLRQVQLRTRILTLDPRVARHLAPAQGGAVLDGPVAQALLDRLLDEGTATEFASPVLVVADGQIADLMVINQVAYLSGFDLLAAPGGLMVDPSVGVCSEGSRLQVQPELLANGAVRLDFAFEMVELLRQAEVGLDSEGSSLLNAEVTMQVPVFAHQSWSAQADFGVEQGLVLPAIHLAGADHALLVVVFLDQAGDALPAHD